LIEIGSLREQFLYIKQIIIPASVLSKLQWKHHVTEDEIKEVFKGRHKIFFAERGDVEGENLYLTLGPTQSGRYLSIFFIYKRNKKALIISARDMTLKERRRYERK
jgi:hypothetical protein